MMEISAAYTHAHAKRVLVIGAGLAGACAAYALARQGWQVQVLDAAAQAAQGASALPVGLMAARKGGAKSAQNGQPDWDGQGMPCTRRWLEHLTQQGLLQPGLDWQNCGTAHSALGQENLATSAEPRSWQWQADACWVKPQRLVAACLSHPAMICVWQTEIQQILQLDDGWQVQTADGSAWQAEALVLAASVGSHALLQSMPQGAVRSALWRLQTKSILKGAAGQAIYAPWQSDWDALLPWPAYAPHACNGSGHFVPAVAGENGSSFWLSGATYVHEGYVEAANTDAGQAENLERLGELLPSLRAVLEQQTQQGQIQRFVSVRCSTPTGWPVLAELGPRCWVCTGFGSRGLSYAPLAAEYLAQEMLKSIAAQAIYTA